jgi:hypothetical protein
MSVRRLLRGFYRVVHPDLLQQYSEEVRVVNDKSLKELNSYIDRVETRDALSSPFVTRRLQFFVPLVDKRKQPLLGLTRPVSLELPSIGPMADMLEKEEAAVNLIRNVEDCMDYEDERFSSKSSASRDIEPIMKSAGSSPRTPESIRRSLDSIWRQEAEYEAVRTEIFGTPDSDYREYLRIMIHNKLLAKYSKIKHPGKRAIRIRNIPSEVDELVEAKLGPGGVPSETIPHKKLQIIKSGFYPDLVFFDPTLIESEREEGILRVSGLNLELDPETWLLENLWKAVRAAPVPVPIVLGREYISGEGFLTIPFNFDLAPLTDFLENNLDETRAARKQLIDSFVAV